MPRTDLLAREIATKNVEIRVAPWVSYQGKRYWVVPNGDHILYRIPADRSR